MPLEIHVVVFCVCVFNDPANNEVMSSLSSSYLTVPQRSGNPSLITDNFLFFQSAKKGEKSRQI